jgi:hypothetical protein
VGVSGDLYVGGTVTANKLVVAYTTVTQTVVTSPDLVHIENTTNSVSTNSGALTVLGGVGIAKNLYVGGTIFGNILGQFQLGDVAPQHQYYVALATKAQGGGYAQLEADPVLIYDTTNNMLTVPNTSATSISVKHNTQIGGTLSIVGNQGTVTILSYNGVTFRASEVTGFIGGEAFVPLTSGLGLFASTIYYVTAVFGPDRFILSTTPGGSGVGTIGTRTIVGNTGSAPGLRVTSSATIGSSLTVGGPLTVNGTETSSIAGDLIVGGALTVNSTETSSIAGDLIVGGALTVNSTETSSIAGDLIVGGALTVNSTGTSTIAGDLVVSGNIVGGGIRTTSSPTPPQTPPPTVGDIWYNSDTDAIYRFIQDGVGNLYWLDITGPAISSHII